ncbi:copper chaperone PCu(A)C [Cryobacterium sp. TMT2-10]|uniref:Copper chaperone PCu(A)C n=1 Tax=Cryobacterium shii TaxID=1259235 RepID=A0AAQ2C433_9MICO|nr:MULTISPECIES: copper chaperone PCu(A)C [Cryobacterium]TFC41825.1 copper chaperone PCu(A)C [Cryobacterium shii]TFD42174.1 copper chaperone PCu(A)C [Cryobacterium sp. TMT2-10]
MKITSTPTRLVVAAAALLLTLSGCAGTAETPAPAADTTPEGSSLTMTDAWVKAADSGMSGAFGLLENSGAEDVTVTSAGSPAAPMLELHETVANDAGDMIMQKKEDGFVIPAGGSIELAPGGNHIMFMGLAAPLAAGDDVTVTLNLSDGSSFVFTAPVKDYTGANETYEGGNAK